MGDVITTTKHSHDQGENKVKAAKLRGAMKEYATAARGKSSQIIADNVVLVWFPLTPLQYRVRYRPPSWVQRFRS